MAIEVRPIHPEFAAEIGGIELARSFDPTMVDRIWEAIDRYAVLVFHDQHLDDEGLRNFAGSNCQFRARMCNGFQHPPRRADQGQKDGDSVAIAAS